jgi:hypothetical protein
MEDPEVLEVRERRKRPPESYRKYRYQEIPPLGFSQDTTTAEEFLYEDDAIQYYPEQYEQAQGYQNAIMDFDQYATG